MPTITRIFLPAAWLLLGTLAHAADIGAADKTAAMQLAKDSGCLSCHALNEKVVGPSYASVAEKYKDQSDAAAALAQSIQYGSKGKWGRIPMPAHPSISAEDLNKLARWVLTVQK